MADLQQRAEFTQDDGPEGLAALNRVFVGTCVAVMDLDGRIILQYDDGRALALYCEDDHLVVEDVEVFQC